MLPGRDLEYAVVGRLNKEHDAYSIDPQQIRQIIADALTIYVYPSDIIHVPPNFIICLNNAHEQATLLAAHPLLHTNYFLLEILPWCKEHEWCQMPWISGDFR